MARFLIDANLPFHFGLWNSDEYLHVFKINDEWSDTEIWNYARQHDLVIVTKDTDFSDRIILGDPPPRVIHVRIGNMKIRNFHVLLNKIWPEVCELITTHKLIRVYPDYIECIR
jgi:predicted nuclease of predicted toxin-antitoxin system